ncbi:Uncharacterised protein [Weissella viridescens]|uniref:Uncharacterized protein n=1 Tax=Weissella viridescens TaxID=1629 RepID=A0A380P2Y0_WEIVI|nr:Uncharacterised protein [Weissella viridescens]
MSNNLIEVNVKTPDTATHIAISTLGTVGVVVAALAGTALLAHIQKHISILS